jgi:hypothetical protein
LGVDAAGLKVIDCLTRYYSGFTRDEWLDRIDAGRILIKKDRLRFFERDFVLANILPILRFIPLESYFIRWFLRNLGAMRFI